MQIRLPKAILTNLEIDKTNCYFDIYINKDNKDLILRIHDNKEDTVE